MKFCTLRKIFNVVFISTALVLLLSAGLIELFGRVFSYSGQICIPTGKSERCVVASAEDDAGAGTVSPDQLPFDNPELRNAFVDKNARYIARQLPFPVRLEGINVISRQDPENLLILPDGQETRVQVNDAVTVGGETFLVKEERPWTGLLQEAAGKPFVSLAIEGKEGAWHENILLGHEEWRHVDASTAVRFQWTDDSKAESVALPGLESARWGVIDGGSATWFDSLDVGAGATLSGGGSVTLLKVDGARPAIQVEIVQSGKKRNAWVGPQERKEPLVQFEHPAGSEYVVLLSASRNHFVKATAFHRGEKTEETELECGRVWSPANVPWRLRVDQALELAVPISEEDSVYRELVLVSQQNDGRVLRLRQDDRKPPYRESPSYVRRQTPPVMKYAFVIEEPGHKARKFTLGPGDAFKSGQWEFEQAQDGPDPMKQALLNAECRPLRGMMTYPLAIGLALLVWMALHRI